MVENAEVAAWHLGSWDGFDGARGSKAVDGAKLSEGAGEGLWTRADQIFHSVIGAGSAYGSEHRGSGRNPIPREGLGYS